MGNGDPHKNTWGGKNNTWGNKKKNNSNSSKYDGSVSKFGLFVIGAAAILAISHAGFGGAVSKVKDIKDTKENIEQAVDTAK